MKFDYRATDERGRLRAGTLDAPGLAEAADLLRARDLQPSSLERKGAAEEGPPEGPDAFAFFNRSLARMVEAGLPLPRAVREAASGLRRGRFKEALERLESDLRQGKSFEDSIPPEFPPYYAAMVKAGVASGNLAAVLLGVARNAEGSRRAVRALSGALAYPALILLLGAAMVAALLLFFVPIYRDLQRTYYFEPSFPVRVALRWFGSAGLQAAWVLGLAAAAGIAWLCLTRSVAGERLLFRVPLIGRIRRHLFGARLAGCLAVLLRSRVPLPRALPVALGASGSLELARDSDRLAARAAEGAGLAELLGGVDLLPPGAVAHLALAERGGDAARAAEELASLFTAQAVSESDTLHLVLAPAALVAVGTVVVTLLVSVVVPYFRFLEQFGR